MRKKEVEENLTDSWRLYEIGKNYNRLRGLYDEGKENYDYYHDKQWEGLKRPTNSSEPIVLNIIKPIIKYKTNIVNQSSYEIVFNPNTYETLEDLEILRSVTKGLNQFLMRIWEKSQSGKKAKKVVKKSAINSEGIMYFYPKEDTVYSEEIDKNNIYYGNESEVEIQNQPYILVTRRLTVEEVKDMARYYREKGLNELTDEEIETITSDMDYYEQQGKEYMMEEISEMCLLIIKFKKNKEGIICCSASTKTCDIYKNQDTGCKLYPFAHFIWEEEEGYARGISEVRGLLPNQRELNKTATRIAIATKIAAFPKLVVDSERVVNRESLNQVGSTVELTNMRADDVSKVISFLRPAQMSNDAYKLMQDLITQTRELAGAGDNATGNVDPTQASGKAILAVQQANQMPINEQVDNYKYFLEDCGNIIFDIIKAYFVDGLTLYTTTEEVNDLGQTESVQRPFKISQKELEELDVDIKIDITPQSPYDRLAQEIALENMLFKNIIKFEEYVESLPEGSSMRKPVLEAIIRKRKEVRKQIAVMQQQMNEMDSAIKQEIINQGGMVDEMSNMQAGGNVSEGTNPEQNNLPM